MKKILFVLGKWSNGGIEKVIATYCKFLSGDDLQFDVFAFEKEESVFDQEMRSYGAKIFSPSYELQGNYITRNIRREKEFLNIASSGYDIIHYNTSFAMAYIFCYFLKRRNKETKIIFHSHGDSVNAPYKWIKVLFNNIVKKLFENIPDYCLACADKAGRWLYSAKTFSSDKYMTVMNAFDFKAYAYDEDARDRQHKEWGIKDELVIGTIGRFNYQKNPYFILEIIKELKRRGVHFKFIWVGKGEEKEEIEKNVFEEELSSVVEFVESTSNVPQYLAGMDFFILPSRYEGLVIVLLEAQASGLMCLASDTQTREVKLTERIHFLPIDSVNIWVDAMMKDFANDAINVDQRKYPEREIAESRFDLKSVIEDIKKIYEEVV